MDMGGSGDPAQTNIIAAHGTDGWRTAGGRTENQFDLRRKKYDFGAHEAHRAHRAQAGGRQPAATGGGRRPDGKSVWSPM